MLASFPIFWLTEKMKILSYECSSKFRWWPWFIILMMESDWFPIHFNSTICCWGFGNFGQGFQFFVDDSGGFSAVAADFLESIADEYPNTPVLLYTVRGPGLHTNLMSQKQTVSRDLHDAVSFSRLSSFCKLIVPVGLPLLSRSK